MKKISSLFLLALISGAVTLGAYKVFFEPRQVITDASERQTPFINTSFPAVATSADDVNFIEAAENTVHAVVHVKNVTISKAPTSLFDFYYGSGGTPRAQVGTGSGVIISPDGYIVTNNHVIANATELQITLNNNKTYTAELIGTDAETDIALLKIDPEEDLPYLAFGDSNQVRLGEWVLAVGNPFNLTSTVTAGIISAKARDLDERDDRFQSFIQTDAAVNPGNSGGALVNIRGELIGINTAITSQTGSYVGYSFAVPSNIARKVVEDIMEFGNVQIGNIGIRGIDAKNVSEGIDETEGVYIDEIIEDSGADQAGLQSGDIIKSIDGIKVSKFADLTGYLRSKRPNDRVSLSILRNSNEITVPVTLLKNTTYDIRNLGLSVKELSQEDIRKMGDIEGVKIVNSVSYWKEGNFDLEGKVLVAINDMKTASIDDVKEAISNLSKYRSLSILVINENGERERIYIRD
ncbi:PDZ domain-containing protein [Robertkochia marina]|uniref:PDZ domain-containing protein n=1 Tax=Robertkochia marina TaxID=1227945 RepID=A0A4S3M140_9FLAO|nr:trypsin-like peptidase domain-containing protein [Robertkochia marina]THD68071.1 PDZ domain-containing protein [Robertkochia marina]TRZ42644.1 PDZ domain-containing protein [Robertkochia marina]